MANTSHGNAEHLSEVYMKFPKGQSNPERVLLHDGHENLEIYAAVQKLQQRLAHLEKERRKSDYEVDRLHEKSERYDRLLRRLKGGGNDNTVKATAQNTTQERVQSHYRVLRQELEEYEDGLLKRQENLVDSFAITKPLLRERQERVEQTESPVEMARGNGQRGSDARNENNFVRDDFVARRAVGLHSSPRSQTSESVESGPLGWNRSHLTLSATQEQRLNDYRQRLRADLAARFPETYPSAMSSFHSTPWTSPVKSTTVDAVAGTAPRRPQAAVPTVAIDRGVQVELAARNRAVQCPSCSALLTNAPHAEGPCRQCSGLLTNQNASVVSPAAPYGGLSGTELEQMRRRLRSLRDEEASAKLARTHNVASAVRPRSASPSAKRSRRRNASGSVAQIPMAFVAGQNAGKSFSIRANLQELLFSLKAQHPVLRQTFLRHCGERPSLRSGAPHMVDLLAVSAAFHRQLRELRDRKRQELGSLLQQYDEVKAKRLTLASASSDHVLELGKQRQLAAVIERKDTALQRLDRELRKLDDFMASRWQNEQVSAHRRRQHSMPNSGRGDIAMMSNQLLRPTVASSLKAVPSGERAWISELRTEEKQVSKHGGVQALQDLRSLQQVLQ